MKRVIFLITLLIPFLFISCRSTQVFSTDLYSLPLESTHSFVYRFNDDTVSKMSDDGSDRIYPASITKLLTALTALYIMPADTLINPGDEVYLSESGSSSAYIRPHHTLTLEMLIEAMMLPSGNDAAYAVAAGCGAVINGSGFGYEENIAAFMSKMNEFAAELGCSDSNFTVPDGYAGNEHYSSMEDMIIIGKAAAENEIIMKYASLHSDDVVYASGHTNTWINTNKLLDPDSDYYNENVIGLKTGSLGGYYNLMTLYDNGETKLLIGVFGSESENDRFSDALDLIEAELETSAKSK